MLVTDQGFLAENKGVTVFRRQDPEVKLTSNKEEAAGEEEGKVENKPIGSSEELGEEEAPDSKSSVIDSVTPEEFHIKNVYPPIESVRFLKDEPLHIPKRLISPQTVKSKHKFTFGAHSFSPTYPWRHDRLNENKYNSDKKPNCAEDDKHYCEKDVHYPMSEILDSAQQHATQLLELYADVASLDTELSVALPGEAKGDESYVCPSNITYAQPFRAKNKSGKWMVIVNNLQVNYQLLTQSVRLEECLATGESCPLIPHCYQSRCSQKFNYHRFLVYVPYDPFFPFAIESFKLPSACACHLNEN
ncbi:hypothetical protein HAZT_HAZT003723 [Hyalella azteca]|uniref:Neurotrophin 1-like n=1 Tax=Hyalella azteca TaxID=294128 RepID=A0A6A0GT64_HYAAZ|nr:neurotrophin 1-like [Hyalella azteca]KAA0185531.1 hypothetical protein HAZT_HAZT003723 [Hyalella azteca]